MQRRGNAIRNGRQFLEKARALILELQERNPRDPTVPYLLGAIESELRNYEAAIPLLERIDPLDSVCRARSADTYAKVQRTDDAISEMQKALDLVPEQPVYHQILIGYSLERAQIRVAVDGSVRRSDEGREPRTSRCAGLGCRKTATNSTGRSALGRRFDSNSVKQPRGLSHAIS